MTWQREQLLKALHDKTLKGGWAQWALLEVEEDRQEFYLIQSAQHRVELDQSREVHNQVFKLRAYIEKPDGRLGTSESPLFQKLDLNNQLQDLEKKAMLGGEKTWHFPERWEKSNRQPQKAYPPMVDDLVGCATQIYQDLERSIRESKNGEFNSAELFVTREKRRRTLSTGFTNETLESRIYAEVCFSATDRSTGLSEEFLITRWAAHPEQLDFTKMCSESAEFAKASLQTEKPPSGQYAVLLHADVLRPLFHDVLSQLNARQRYFQLPYLEKGKELIPQFSGVPFAMSLNPDRDFCFASGAYSGEGSMQHELTLASGNVILQNPTSSQMSQYLDQPETTVLGSVVVTPESVESYEELKGAKPQVLEILQFSGLFTNEMDLTFSSEIRLARLYDGQTGKAKFIKGGNLSGHFPTNFKGVLWGGKVVVENHEESGGGGTTYVGPQMALVTDVSVSS
jgi:hypothetical protein